VSFYAGILPEITLQLLPLSGGLDCVRGWAESPSAFLAVPAKIREDARNSVGNNNHTA